MKNQARCRLQGACWRTDLRGGTQGGMMMNMSVPSTEGIAVSENTSLSVSQPTLQSGRDPMMEKGVIAMILDDVNRSIEAGHPNSEGLIEMRDFLIECVKDIDQRTRERKSLEKTQEIVYNP